MEAATQPLYFEVGPIRPPSEAYSLLIRVTRNCPWNRCLFCPVYKRARFELRTVDEVKRDILAARTIADRVKEAAWRTGCGGRISEAAASIYRSSPDDGVRNVALWLYAGGETAFLQDANSLIMRTAELTEVVRFLRETLPSITRVTSYGRSKTAAKRSLEELVMLKEAGLSRLHIGLESGSDRVLAYMEKGVTAAEHVSGGRKLVESAISLSEYVMPGLGGRKWSREHATETARVLNEIEPDFIRLRSLMVREDMPLFSRVESGEFELLSDDEMVEEIGWLVEGLECRSEIKSDHVLNLLPEIDGRLPDDKERLLGVIRTYLALPDAERLNFRLGRRAGYYERLADIADPARREAVERIQARLEGRSPGKAEEVLARLRAQCM